MGLYDSFVLKEALPCPICGSGESRIQEFQTKEFGEFFETFHVGDRVLFIGILQLADGSYPTYSGCAQCNAWIDGEIEVKDGIFVGIVNIKAKTQEEKWGSD